ncbi:MAG: hypothetical protein IJI62_06600 [Lachnospiraceae bacterium]|nr:hypothetical protein [Lachnospiraceae bacterium]
MSIYTIGEIPQLRILGRNDGLRDPLNVYWHGGGVEMNIRASELWLDVRVDYDYMEPWLVVFIDGAPIQRRMLTKEDRRIPIFRGMEPGVLRRVQIIRDTQPMPFDPKIMLQFTGLETDGTFEELPAPALRLEFCGDSITCGEGLAGFGDDNEWRAAYLCNIGAYTLETARLLSGECRMVSLGGWGSLMSYDGLKKHAIPLYYEKVCGMYGIDIVTTAAMAGAMGMNAAGSFQAYDFSSWPADVVIVNLGTNDSSGIANTLPAEEQAAGLEAFTESAVQFLTMIRRCNPGAYMIWAYGMLGDPLRPQLTEAIRRYQEQTGDTRAEYLPLPNTEPGEFGCRLHPGLPSHKKAAQAIAARIRELQAQGLVR